MKNRDYKELSPGSIVHIYNRGNNKERIFLDEQDYRAFLFRLGLGLGFEEKILKNEKLLSIPHSRIRIESDNKNSFKLYAFCLMPNHFHLLLQEIREGGISKFMQKLGIGYTNYFNLRHRETGKVFQGGYKCRTVRENQFYLEYLSVYIQVKNVLELFPGGIEEALKDIDKAFEFAEIYKFSSFPDFIGKRESLIIEKDILGDIFPTPEDYKKFAKEIIESKKYNMLEELKIDEK